MVGVERGTVRLEPHQPAWKWAYREEVERLQAIVGDRIEAFEHVGSTAVEGVVAKPIVDMLAVVDNLDEAEKLRPVLESAGYEYRPNDDVPDRLFFAKGPRTNRTHYLSLTERDSNCYRASVAFRDYLRENPDTATRYAELKRKLAAAHADDRAAYTEAKSSFVRAVLERA